MSGISQAGPAFGFHLDSLWPPMWPPSPLTPRKLSEWIHEKLREPHGDTVELSHEATPQSDDVYGIRRVDAPAHSTPSSELENSAVPWVQQRINLLHWQQANAVEE